MSLVITGAGGQLGRQVAELLLDRLDPAELVLVTRRPEELGDLAARGAQVRPGDFDRPETLVDAFAGAGRLLLISTDAVGRRVAQHGAAIDAAKAAGIEHVAYTSVPNPVAENPAAVVPDHAGTEGLLRDSGLAWSFLRNGLYAEFQVPEAQHAAQSGQLVHNRGEGKTAYVSRADCAAAAAAVLAGGPEHDGVAYDITGPELLGAGELASLYGPEVTSVAVDDDAFAAGLQQGGLPAEVAGLIASFGRAIREGFLDQQTDAVQRLTGRPPRALADVLAG